MALFFFQNYILKEDTTMLSEDYHSKLYHHGVKGQKWGVQHATKPTSNPSKSSNNRK